MPSPSRPRAPWRTRRRTASRARSLSARRSRSGPVGRPRTPERVGRATPTPAGATVAVGDAPDADRGAGRGRRCSGRSAARRPGRRWRGRSVGAARRRTPDRGATASQPAARLGGAAPVGDRRGRRRLRRARRRARLRGAAPAPRRPATDAPEFLASRQTRDAAWPAAPPIDSPAARTCRPILTTTSDSLGMPSTRPPGGRRRSRAGRSGRRRGVRRRPRRARRPAAGRQVEPPADGQLHARPGPRARAGARTRARARARRRAGLGGPPPLRGVSADPRSAVDAGHARHAAPGGAGGRAGHRRASCCSSCPTSLGIFGGGDPERRRPTPTPVVATPDPRADAAARADAAGLRDQGGRHAVARSRGRSGVTLDELLAANTETIENPDRIEVGDEIIIPVPVPEEVGGGRPSASP